MKEVKRGNKLYEGKAKVVYESDMPDHVLLYFKDDATAFDGAKKDVVKGKGAMNAEIAELMFRYLGEHGVKSHFVDRVDERTLLVRRVEIIPIEVVIRNFAAGSIVRRLGIKEKTEFTPPLYETFLKNDELHDPLLTDEHIRVMKLAEPDEVKTMVETALKVNKLMRSFYDEAGIILVDFKLEFGKTSNGEIILADEISPDGCRLWDKETGEKLDKDRFRHDLGDLMEGYKKILAKIKGEG